LDGLAHGPLESYSALNLTGYVLGDQLSVQLGLTNLLDVNVNFALNDLLDLGSNILNTAPTPPDYDARSGGMKRELE